VARAPCKRGSGPAQQSQVPRAETDCNTNDDDDVSPYFGDPLGPVDEKHIRLGSINLNNTLQNAEGDERLFRAIHDLEIKLLCMQEVGCNWSNIPRKQAFQERLNRVFGTHETRSCLRHNVHDLAGTRNQWGGTGVLSRGKIKYYTMGAGGDPTGLGRWSWARIRGKSGVVLRYVSVYCPCENKEGILAVWAQHKVYLQGKNDDRDPRAAFLEDLKEQLSEWIEQGDQVLVCGDLNHDILSPTIVSFFEKFHMTNLIHDRHDSYGAPSTYYQNEQGRSVDGIWGTPGLQVAQGGYLRPGEFPGDHSLLWVDISYQSALGHNPPRPQLPVARRLQLQNERSVKQYLREYKARVHEHKLLKRQFYLESTTRWNVPLTQAQIQEYEAIDFLKTKCMKIAERKCRQIKAGQVSFSEATIVPLRHIAWWNVAIRRREGKRVHPVVWRRKKKEAGLEKLRTAEMTLQDMIGKRREAVRAFREAKKKHETLRLEHINKMSKKNREHNTHTSRKWNMKDASTRRRRTLSAFYWQ
jgi:exonuclease III